jgi:hypothetical protein
VPVCDTPSIAPAGPYRAPQTLSDIDRARLHQLFPKLGVTTRAALCDALADLPSEQSWLCRPDPFPAGQPMPAA